MNGGGISEDLLDRSAKALEESRALLSERQRLVQRRSVNRPAAFWPPLLADSSVISPELSICAEMLAAPAPRSKPPAPWSRSPLRDN